MVQMVLSSNPRFAIPEHWKTSCQPSNKWVPVSNQGKIRQGKERDGLLLSYAYAVPKILWASNSTAPMTFRLWEASTP